MDEIMDNKDNPQDRSSKEKAEGSRDHVNTEPANVDAGSATTTGMERGSGQKSEPHEPLPPQQGGQGGTGTGGRRARPEGSDITNRPDEVERENQEALPPRGQAKGETPEG